MNFSVEVMLNTVMMMSATAVAVVVGKVVLVLVNLVAQ